MRILRGTTIAERPAGNGRHWSPSERSHIPQPDAPIVLAVSADGTGWRGLWSDHPHFPGDLDTLLAAGPEALTQAVARLSGGDEITLEKIAVLPPVGRASKILCIGMNYADHIAETGLPTPEHIPVFTRYLSSFVGHTAPLVRPAASEQFDYEAELGVILGKPLRHASRPEAQDAIAGYTMVNDGSIRDAQLRTSQWTLGKNFDATGSIGPWMVTAGAVPQGGKGLRILGKLNGDIVQDGSTSDMVFDVADILVELSAVMTLDPGDVIATGTPAGVAMGAVDPRWLRAGDDFEVEIEGLGILQNPVVDEAP